MLSLAWWALREMRTAAMLWLIMALGLAVTAVSSVAWVADRMERGLTQEARPLLGGDLVVLSDQALPPDLTAWAQARALKSTVTATFASMARSDTGQGGDTRLVSVRALDSAWPIASQVQLSGKLLAERAPPAAGTVWVDPALLNTMGLKVGDGLWLGRLRLTVAGALQQESDKGGGWSSFSPSVLMSMADLPATGLIQPASRVTWRLVLAKSEQPQALMQFETQVNQAIRDQGWRGVRLESLENARPELKQTRTRAERMMRLIALLTVALASVAVAVAANGHARSRMDGAALGRVWGLSSRELLMQQFFALAMAYGLGTGLGLLGGWGLHAILLHWLAPLWGGPLPGAGLWPMAQAGLLALMLLVAFALPPVLQLVRVPPMRVIRRDLGQIAPWSGVALVLGLLGLAGLLAVQAGDLNAALAVCLGVLAASAVLACGGWVLLGLMRALTRALGHRLGITLSMALKALLARPAWVISQTVALGLGMMALTMLWLLQFDLVKTWQAATPAEAPNRFAINVQAAQADPFLLALSEQGVLKPDFYPMFKGRLSEIKGQRVQDLPMSDERNQRLLEREFNLSQMEQAPSHNPTVSGRWQTDAPGWSVEEGLMKSMGWQLGDVLSFDVASERMSAPIAHVRRVDWASMRVNFFVIWMGGTPQDRPYSWIAAWRAGGSEEAQRQQGDRTLTQLFPNITLIDLSASLAQVRSVIGRMASAVEWLFGLALLTGLWVMACMAWLAQAARTREMALMRALGASRSLLSGVLAVEWWLLGLLAGLLSGALALGAEAWIALAWLELPWQAPWAVLPVVALLSGALTWAVGYWTLRQTLGRPAAVALREAVEVQ